jgi:hypothetical protein
MSRSQAFWGNRWERRGEPAGRLTGTDYLRESKNPNRQSLVGELHQLQITITMTNEKPPQSYAFGVVSVLILLGIAGRHD